MTTIPQGGLRTVARYAAVALMGAAVLVATGDGFAQSYAGLYGWAIEHGLAGWKADSFPLMVDLFIVVGELGLFLLAIDGHRLRRSFMAWLDLLVPALVAASGWGASLIFNVGHVADDFATRATAAVPPLASMIGLLVLLRTLHRYVAQAAVDSGESTQPLTVAAEPGEPALPEVFDDTPPALLAWLRGKDVPAVGSGAPEPDPVLPDARERFSEALSSGAVPSVRAIKRELRVGHARAVRIRDALAAT